MFGRVDRLDFAAKNEPVGAGPGGVAPPDKQPRPVERVGQERDFMFRRKKGTHRDGRCITASRGRAFVRVALNAAGGLAIGTGVVFDFGSPKMISLNVVPTKASTDPLALFVDCHERIRRFCRLAVRIASEPAPDSDIKDAAFAVHRYFHRALPLHIEDEDLSLLPRLEAVGDAQVKQALEQMSDEHGPLDSRIRALIPSWRLLSERPSELAAMKSEMFEEASAIEHLMLAHLVHEETVIFPAARRLLSERSLGELAAQMRDRRRPT